MLPMCNRCFSLFLLGCFIEVDMAHCYHLSEEDLQQLLVEDTVAAALSVKIALAMLPDWQ